MPSFLNSTEFENGELNDSNGLLDNQSMVLEFALFDKKIVKIIASTSLGMKVLFGISLLILETLGNYLLFCMVLYEKFGMDSKKRTITNQLLSRMILALIFFNIFFMPIYFFGFLIPFSKYLQQFCEWSICSNITFNLLFDYRLLSISCHWWFWSVSYFHSYFANTSRNGDFQDSLHVQIFYYCCNGWVFLYKFCNII